MLKFLKKKEATTLTDHLNELRKRLIIIILANFTAMILLFNQASRIMDYLLLVNPGMELVYTTPSELLMVYIEMAFIMAIIVCSPITVYEIWAFVEKGLYTHEKKYVLISLLFGVIFFALGVAFCYFVVLPTTLAFFIRIAIAEIEAMVSIKSYVSFVNMLLLSFGLVFEMPVVVYLLTKIGVLKPAFMIKNRGLLIVVIFIFAAIITPPDVISQIMLSIPMILLLQISIFICQFVDKQNQKKLKI